MIDASPALRVLSITDTELRITISRCLSETDSWICDCQRWAETREKWIQPRIRLERCGFDFLSRHDLQTCHCAYIIILLFSVSILLNRVHLLHCIFASTPATQLLFGWVPMRQVGPAPIPYKLKCYIQHPAQQIGAKPIMQRQFTVA